MHHIHSRKATTKVNGKREAGRERRRVTAAATEGRAVIEPENENNNRGRRVKGIPAMSNATNIATAEIEKRARNKITRLKGNKIKRLKGNAILPPFFMILPPL
ncbi:hypothetical protein PIB30_032749 [Stylosanthes scabra]|uniref:Uncharacterized protein n=1 Tax=Stylosanthes scabra TaxID=79078 RepID=A0ABU6TCI7_9FABA|nr:hypothetical protein [Stylosanthes scabra]